MIVNKEKGFYGREFHSWTEFVDFSNDKNSSSRRASRQDLFNFTEVDKFSDAVELSQKGWSKGVTLYEQYKKGITQLDDVSYDYEYDVFGDVIDIGEFVTGNPLCMLKFSRKLEERFGDIMHIIVNIGAVYLTEPDAFYRRGVSLIKLIEHVERNGISTAVTGVWTTKKASFPEYYALSVPIKSPGKLVDVDRIMFATSHPAMLRRLCFSVSENEPRDVRDTFGFYSDGPYGHSCEIDADCDVYVPSPQNYFHSDSAASKWLTQTVFNLKI